MTRQEGSQITAKGPEERSVGEIEGVGNRKTYHNMVTTNLYRHGKIEKYLKKAQNTPLPLPKWRKWKTYLKAGPIMRVPTKTTVDIDIATVMIAKIPGDEVPTPLEVV